MERWRWLPRDLGQAHVVVNVPDFTLGVYKDGAPVWRTKIVVGKPGELATPLLSETMKFLTINPTWNVPPSIIRNEYLPALERDPDALERIGLRVSYNQDGSLRVYQPPGERNALGRIRFNFPNQFLVYQHDTPDKKLFARDSRAFSHGCMRVQDPEKYAEVLLSLSQPEENFTIARIRSLYGDQERTINLKQPIPVHVTYQTAFVDEQGQLNFRHDIYGLDAATLKLMRGDERMIADTPIARPQNTSSKPVMARLPEREDREWQGQYQYRGGGWFGFGGGERAYASSPYRSHRSPLSGSGDRRPRPSKVSWGKRDAMVPSARRDIRASGNNHEKKTKSGAKEAKGADSPSRLIDARIKKLGDWRGETLARVRSLIKEADPDVVEEVKWRKAIEFDVGGSGVGARRHHLHRRDVQGGREDDLRQGRRAGGSCRPLQLQPRRQHPARHRYP